jgi:hypothetical protein
MPRTALNPLTSIAPGCLMGQVTPGRFERCSLRVRMSRPLEDGTDKSRPRHGFRQASRRQLSGCVDTRRRLHQCLNSLILPVSGHTSAITRLGPPVAPRTFGAPATSQAPFSGMVSRFAIASIPQRPLGSQE